MEYHLLTYSLLFLPIVVVIYQLMPSRFRWIMLLITDYVFFWMLSGPLLIFLLLTTVITYITGQALVKASSESGLKGKALTKRKRIILALGIMIPLALLVVFKYLKIFGINLIAPIGISYYTLQTISYMTDVYRGTLKPEKNLFKVALYLSFFPQIIEGPISRYSEIADDLYAGRDIEYHNFVYGYQRIAWGLFKKMMVADRLAGLVFILFKEYEKNEGASLAIAAVCYTIQLYNEFSGCIDIVIGSGEIFGIKLPENFRQPFFADNASDFWRRWHITLGTWLKDYIFYSVSLAKPVKNLAKKVKKTFGVNVSKFVAPTIALFFVWLCNGIWHGAGSTYLFYGMYYFVFIFFETITEPSFRKFYDKHGISDKNILLKILRTAKLWFIVVIGELFFRAPTLTQGFEMFKMIFTGVNMSKLPSVDFGIDKYDRVMSFLCVILIFIVDILHEKGICIRDRIAAFKKPVRWVFWYAMILSIILTGAYGAGYTVMDMIYAGF